MANHQLRLYYTHKVWCGGTDESLIECSKAQEWFTDYFDSEFVTVCKGGHLRDTMRGGSRLSLLILIIMLSFYILFLIPSFLIHLHKLFSMQLGPGTASLACARLIVPFSSFSAWSGELESIAKEKDSQRNIRRMFKMLREVS